jgi:hypothetical protein
MSLLTLAALLCGASFALSAIILAAVILRTIQSFEKGKDHEKAN